MTAILVNGLVCSTNDIINNYTMENGSIMSELYNAPFFTVEHYPQYIYYELLLLAVYGQIPWHLFGPRCVCTWL